MNARTPAPPAFVVVLLLAALGPGGCGRGEAGHLVARPAKLDFGRVVWKDVVDRTLVLENRGPSPVLVTDVVPNCVCFQVLPFRQNIGPSEKREVTIRFASGHVPPMPMRGKKLDVLSDDPEAGHLVVPMEGEPFAPYEIVPPKLDVHTLDVEGRAASWTVQVRSIGRSSVEVGTPKTYPADVLEARVAPQESGADIVVRIPEGAPIGHGRLKGWISIPLALTLPDGAKREVQETVRVAGDWP